MGMRSAITHGASLPLSLETWSDGAVFCLVGLLLFVSSLVRCSDVRLASRVFSNSSRLPLESRVVSSGTAIHVGRCLRPALDHRPLFVSWCLPTGPSGEVHRAQCQRAPVPCRCTCNLEPPNPLVGCDCRAIIGEVLQTSVDLNAVSRK